MDEKTYDKAKTGWRFTGEFRGDRFGSTLLQFQTEAGELVWVIAQSNAPSRSPLPTQPQSEDQG
jgi:hypothetical protein